MSPNNGYLYGWESKKFINTAVLGLPRNCELLRQLRERAGNVDLDNYRWGQIGPRLLTELIRGLSLEHLALPESAFYAVGYKEAWKFFHPRHTAFIEEALENSSQFTYGTSSCGISPSPSKRWPLTLGPFWAGNGMSLE